MSGTTSTEMGRETNVDDLTEKEDFAPIQEDSATFPAASKEHHGDTDLRQQHTYIDDSSPEGLSADHRAYLLQRHGTLQLDPLPSADPADPYNWPQWKKTVNLILVGFHAMMATFIAAGIIPAYESIALDLGVSLQRASYLTSAQIAVLGFAPLFWKPLSNRFGRRPVWLISTLLSGVLNVCTAVSHSYGSMMACRCLVAFFISPASAIGSGVVVETVFKKDRGRYMGLWTLMVTLGPPSAPFLMGFVAKHVDYRWIYWIFAITNGVQFVAYFFFGPETRYLRAGVQQGGSAFKREYLNFKRIDPTPLHIREFIAPALLGRYLTVTIPAVAYTIVFGFASVFLTVEIPQIFIPKFQFDPQEIGLQFLGLIIGTLIGEQLGGGLSDVWINRRTKKNKGVRPQPEYRLWLSYFGFTLVIVGLIVFGVQLNNAQQGLWNVTPIVGIAITGAGNQIVTTVLVTYAVDCHPEHSSSIGVYVNMVRQTWGFIGPFWFPDAITALGVATTCGVFAAIVFGVSVLPIMVLQLLGGRWRSKHTQDMTATRGD